MSTGGPTRATATGTEAAWTGRPWIARSLRAVAVLGPTVVSFITTWAIVRWFPPHRAGLPTPAWWVGLFAVGTGVLVLCDKAARRLLPLVALFKLTLVFPDQAPSRYAVAMKTGTTRQLQRRIDELKTRGIPRDETRFAETMLEMVAALSVHDRMTRGHCERVRAYTDLIIEEIGMPEKEASRLRWAALLHDVGKLFVSSDILNSPDAPTDAQWEELKSHTWMGDRLIGPLKPWLGEWHRAVGEHHERWDGDGYPNGLSGNDIHLGARIVAVADAFDVMTSTRSYKKPISAVDARAEIARCAGTQFDPRVVRAFLNIGIGRLRLAIGPLAWAANIPATAQVPLAPAVSPVATALTAAASVVAAAASGGFGGMFVPNEAPPAALALEVDEPLPSTTTVVITTTTTTPPATTASTTTEAPSTTTTTEPTTTTAVALAADSAPVTTRPAPRPTTTTTARPTTTTTRPSTTTTRTPTTLPPAPRVDAAMRTLAEDDAPLTIPVVARTATGDLTWRIVTSPVRGTASFTDPVTPATAGNPTDVTAQLVYQPSPDANGSDTVIVEACDGQDRCATAGVALAIAPVADLPRVATESTSTDEDEPLVLTFAELLANDVDPDGSTLTIDAASVASGSVHVDRDLERIEFVPAADDSTAAVVAYTVCGAPSRCAASTVVVDLLPVNDAPAVSAPATATSSVGAAVDLAVSATDAEDDAVTFGATGLPPGLSIHPTTGRITGTALSAGGDQTHLVTVRATETTTTGHLVSPPATISIQVGLGAASPLSRSLAITEVLVNPRPGRNEQMVEITNVGSTTVSLVGVRIVDNVGLFPQLDVTIGANDRRSQASSLAPGGTAVIWATNPDSGTAFAHAPSSALEYYPLFALLGMPLNAEGDDVFLQDSDGRLIDYLRFESPTANPVNLGTAPAGFWDGTVIDALPTAAGQSISSAVNGPADSARCWEFTESGTAAGHCPGATTTLRVNTVAGDVRVASVGARNVL